ncbi:translocase of outer mitochondrial membrane [Saitoella coloradoensis]
MSAGSYAAAAPAHVTSAVPTPEATLPALSLEPEASWTRFVPSSVTSTVDSIAAWRASLGLTNPGTFENLTGKVQKEVLCGNYMFTGIKADLSKAVAVSPVFHLTHGFALGSQVAPPYSFGVFLAQGSSFLRGSMDSDGSLQAMANSAWNSNSYTRAQAQISSVPGQSLLQVEHDYQGSDFSANLKAMNPSILDNGRLTGIFVGNYLQSITSRFALGLEGVWQRPPASAGPESVNLAYVAKYAGDDWIAAAQLLGGGSAINATFYKKLSDKVEAGVDLQLVNGGGNPMMGPQKQAVTAVGAKYEFRAATFRGQVNSEGKIQVYLDKRITPALGMQFAVDVDHAKNAVKLGFGMSLETADDDLQKEMEAQQAGAPGMF